MPNVRTTHFNCICGVLGTFLFFFGFVSYLVKERLYISEAFVSLLAGIVVSPHTTNIINLRTFISGNLGEESESSHPFEPVTHDFARLVLSIQVCLAGVQLPARYARTQWRALATMLGPAMVGMWLISSLFIWAIVCVPGETDGPLSRMPFLHALAVGACIAPTDPVLSNTIIKGRWADKHVPVPMAQLISAESGANDGLGYPFLYFALYLIKYLGTSGYVGEAGDGGAAGDWGGARSAMGMWFGEMWGFTIVLSVVWGVFVGWVARRGLKVAKSLHYVDKESVFATTVVMAVLLVGTCGMVGRDDVLACFVAGNALSWE
ncbi:hypothetical protein PMZ80_009231 [Knufia obscura]|uniref:Cation/H+ exchanger transmembrane domain-containing protein n=1 Tax=Knufia obscura TaxID=1635080 RepID=A0ABR0RCB0_9EURO|nr:hypothetical protein PMZ80_009231 [Knufia obscura]